MSDNPFEIQETEFESGLSKISDINNPFNPFGEGGDYESTILGEMLNSVLNLRKQGFADIEHFGRFIVAKSNENGKYYLFSPRCLKPLEGTESEQIKVIDIHTIYFIQNGRLNIIHYLM